LNVTWGVQNVTITANASTAPDGTSTANLFDDGTTAGVVHQVFQSVNHVQGVTDIQFHEFCKKRQF
jgi:hypothetical protein